MLGYYLVSATALFSSVTAHGMFVHPGPISEAVRGPGVRNYGAISTNIDSLRSPNNAGLCRSAGRGRTTDITLNNGARFTITQAFSNGAQHIGPCSVQVYDADNMGAPPVTITSVAGPNGCARPAIMGFDTREYIAASVQGCPRGTPPGLTTDDMCLSEWSFTVQNADKITCQNCVMRWSWQGQHLSTTNPEFYENCADVRINGRGGGAPPPAPSTTTSSTSSTSTYGPTSAPSPSISSKKCKRKKVSS